MLYSHNLLHFMYILAFLEDRTIFLNFSVFHTTKVNICNIYKINICKSISKFISTVEISSGVSDWFIGL